MAARATPQFDVAVVGGGTTGVIAAIAAGQTGARTCLIESSGYLGGTTYALGNVVSFHNNRMEPVARGVPQALVDRLRRHGGVVGNGHLPNPSGQCGTVTLIDPPTLNRVAFEMMEEAEVDVRLQTVATGVSVEGDRLRSIELFTRTRKDVITAHTFVDTSGDADIAVKSGASIENDVTGQRLTGTSSFRVGNVDHEALLADFKRFPERLILHEDDYLVRTKDLSPEQIMASVRTVYDLPFIYLDNIVRDYVPRSDWAKWGITGTDKSEWGDLKPFGSRVHLSPAAASPSIMFLNTTNVHFDSTNPAELSRAEMEGQRQVALMHTLLRTYVPGFQRSIVVGANPKISVRASVRIVGEHYLTREEVESGARHRDGIARGCYPMSVTSPTQPNIRLHLFVRNGGDYDIPYGCLVPKKVDGLLVAGRCMSGSREAIGSARNGAHCMAAGHAAGVAAALCAKDRIEPRALDTSKLRRVLAEQGAIV